ncbi:MAG: histidinol dehydrogenase [Ilumatobacteraceae bacterium]
MSVMRSMVWGELTPSERQQLVRRGLDDIFDETLRASIGELIEDVRVRGDGAVCDALARHDGVTVRPDELRLDPDEVAAARVDAAVDDAIDDAIDHVRRFNERQLQQLAAWEFESEPGLVVGEKLTPISSVGVFVPSGKASYPSVAYQLAVPAVVAGVPEIVLVVPPLARWWRRCRPCGARRVRQARHHRRVPRQRSRRHRRARLRHRTHPRRAQGGRPRLAARHVGAGRDAAPWPGNRDVAGTDREPRHRRRHRGSAAPRCRPADRGRARQGLVGAARDASTLRSPSTSTSSSPASSPISLPSERMRRLRRSASTAGASSCRISTEAIEVANAYAPEHLQLAIRDADVERAVDGVRHAGEILVGQDTPFSAANFVIGCPASLPTSGFARVSSGVTAATFLKRTAIARADERAIARMAPSVIALADHEGFPAHAQAVRERTR